MVIRLCVGPDITSSDMIRDDPDITTRKVERKLSPYICVMGNLYDIRGFSRTVDVDPLQCTSQNPKSTSPYCNVVPMIPGSFQGCTHYNVASPSLSSAL